MSVAPSAQRITNWASNLPISLIKLCSPECTDFVNERCILTTVLDVNGYAPGGGKKTEPLL